MTETEIAPATKTVELPEYVTDPKNGAIRRNKPKTFRRGRGNSQRVKEHKPRKNKK